jgi:hypothetical protein
MTRTTPIISPTIIIAVVCGGGGGVGRGGWVSGAQTDSEPRTSTCCGLRSRQRAPRCRGWCSTTSDSRPRFGRGCSTRPRWELHTSALIDMRLDRAGIAAEGPISIRLRLTTAEIWTHTHTHTLGEKGAFLRLWQCDESRNCPTQALAPSRTAQLLRTLEPQLVGRRPPPHPCFLATQPSVCPVALLPAPVENGC